MNESKVVVRYAGDLARMVRVVTHADYRAIEERYERWKKDWDDVHNATVEELAALRARVETMFGKGRRDDCDCQECVSFRSLRTKS